MRASGLDRAEVFVTTKLWNDDQGYDSALRALDASLKRLGMDYVDLYLIHWPAPNQDRYLDAWKALLRLREDGKARSIGVSNFAAPHLERIIGETGVAPAVNQVELHPRFQQAELRALHERLGVATESWSPLGQGGLLADPRGGQGRRPASQDAGAGDRPLASGPRPDRDPQVGDAVADRPELRGFRLQAGGAGSGRAGRARRSQGPHRDRTRCCSADGLGATPEKLGSAST